MADVPEHVIVAVVHVDAFHGYGNHFGARCQYGLLHFLIAAEFACACEQARCEYAVAYVSILMCLLISVWRQSGAEDPEPRGSSC